MTHNDSDVLTIRQHFPSVLAPTSSYWVYEQIRDLMEKGVKFNVISPQPYIPQLFRSKSKYHKQLPFDDKFENVRVIRPIHFRIPNYKFYSITNRFLSDCILKAAKGLNFKLIHAHFGNDGVASIALKKKYNVPLITSFYGYDLSDQLNVLKPFYCKLIKAGDLFLALSEDMKSDLIKIGFPEEKIKIHHLGINMRELENQFVLKPKNKLFTFTVVARFSERKGIHDTISAFSKVANTHEKVQLRIVGDGPYKRKLLDLVNNLKLTDKVVFVNNFIAKNPRQTVLKEIANCNVFMLNSYTTVSGSKEGTPIVLMEAQAMGKPCISTFHAGIPEVVLHNQTGILVNERDINEIANSMVTFIYNRSLVNNMGNNSYIHICNEFNNEAQIKKLIDIYLSILS
jgi:glycosyltransferase involved in cell wall biosynthesis